MKTTKRRAPPETTEQGARDEHPPALKVDDAEWEAILQESERTYREWHRFVVGSEPEPEEE